MMETQIHEMFYYMIKTTRKIMALAEKEQNMERQFKYMEICADLLYGMNFRNYPFDEEHGWSEGQ
jgi:hypothetical protein